MKLPSFIEKLKNEKATKYVSNIFEHKIFSSPHNDFSSGFDAGYESKPDYEATRKENYRLHKELKNTNKAVERSTRLESVLMAKLRKYRPVVELLEKLAWDCGCSKDHEGCPSCMAKEALEQLEGSKDENS